MDLKLTRKEYREDGIIGEITELKSGKHFCVSMEHAYDSKNGDGSYAPKLPKGTYRCVRGIHRLHDMKPFETFEVTEVPGHYGILIHVGNYNKDSEGCILIGYGYGGDPRVISQSRMTFAKFMNLQLGVKEFTLVVE